MNKLFTRTTIKPGDSIVARGAVVTGDTIAYKGIIKSFGGKWDPEAKGWRLETEEQAQWVVTCFNERKSKASNDKALDRKKAKADTARAEENKLTALKGDTYPIKGDLEEKFGAKWGPYRRAMLVAQEVAEEAQEFVNFSGKTAEEVDVFLSEHAELVVDGVVISRYKFLLRENDIELKEQAVKECREEQVPVRVPGRRRAVNHEMQNVVRYKTKLFVESEQEEEALSLITQQVEAERAEEKRREEAEAAEKAVFEARLAAAKKPSDSQIGFVKRQLWKWKKDGWNYAVDVHEYRDICVEHRDYFTLMGWPWDLRGSAIRDWSGKI